MLCSCCLSGAGWWGEALITHDLAVVRQTADDIFADAKGPCSRDLINPVPGLGIELGATIW